MSNPERFPISIQYEQGKTRLHKIYVRLINCLIMDKEERSGTNLFIGTSR